MLGKDADRNEYWFFKEDPSKLFVKRFEEVKTELMMDIDEGNGELLENILEP